MLQTPHPPFNLAEPHPKILETLTAHTDCLTMYRRHLPADLDAR